MEQKENVTYTCPMHPEVLKDSPGMCPECGMNLVQTRSKKKHDHGEGRDKHAGHRTESFFQKFVVSLVLSIPVIVYSDLLQNLFAWSAPPFPGSSYLPLALGSVVFFYGGFVFLSSAWRELRAKMPGMMTLIAIAITVAYVYSIFVTFAGQGGGLYWELTTLITIMLLGHWFEMRAVSGAQGALKELSKLLPDTAEVIRDGETKKIPLQELRVNDVVLVRPGGKISADGIVIEGESEVDESIVTGESRPVRKQKESEVIAGSMNGDGSLKIRVTKIGEKTFLSGIMKLVEEAQVSKSKLQLLSDRAAFYLTIIAVVAGVSTLAAWLYAEDLPFAVERMVSVLVVACPHALGLAVPLVASISTTLAARNGFLVRRRLALESAREINTVMFDKTGTLTKGELGIDKIIPTSGVMDSKVIELAASVNAYSEHHIAKAIVREAEKRNVGLQKISGFKSMSGKGTMGRIGDREVLVGNDYLLADYGIKIDEELDQKIKDLSKQGKTAVYVVSDKKTAGAIVLSDIIREESREAVKKLKEMGIKVAMMTGDSEDVASWVARELGIDEYFARVLPGQKAEKVKVLQEKGMKVAMVGDGVNDAPALTQSDLGIAIGAGTNVAIESAGIILVRNDPLDIPKILSLSKKTYSKMLQNLFWATGYNVIALPLAAGVMAAQGILLQPAVAAVFMSLSTVIVAVNAMLMRKTKL